MHLIDWIILSATLLFIVLYGVFKTRGSKNVEEYILGGNNTPWWTVGLSVMATQASAITFLSTPGQAYHDGMGFVQFYFGLPLAMVVICITFIPIYHRLKVFTAYEFLEQRFDVKTRTLASLLFLVQRGLGTGLTIYAPAIIMSSLLGWNLNLMTFLIGVMVIAYTVSGGTRAVNITQKQQMFIIMSGLFITFYIILSYLPEELSFNNILHIAGANDKMNIVDFSFDPEKRYTIWSGIAGGFFLALAYFGTDQSQVQRYLSGKSVKESQMGLIMNGLLKVPMQFFILLIGVMVFIFFQFHSAPLHFNPNNVESINKSEYKADYEALETQLENLGSEKKEISMLYVNQLHQDYNNKELHNRMVALNSREKSLRDKAKVLITKANEDAETNDKDYVFLYFILNFLPKGLVGLLLAVIFSAAMSSSASGLNALASTTAIDLYKRNVSKDKSDKHFVNATKVFTLLWGVIAILFAYIGSLVENLIQLVNIVGSIFYGTVLGIFLVAFYIKYIRAQAIFLGALISQLIIFYIYYIDVVSFLWLNVIGAALTIVLSTIIQLFINMNNPDPSVATE
ncbi:MAG: sodium:solute symporter [Flavobacterium sp. MedPE-SWcel]|uniref:sodium:solute symporter n=1 Tax=uncultured Flavobacterium sp. TaxID=165435 RepID=UPI00091585F4|nr:sodium:solute symporter [uncultured Flavobacterium sp.]OIQ18652.1 MAG: sodium:solute symporter [Flavobacterium sp. MedPE-SWcel]